ncbi:elongation factor Ts, mitochondrial [Teleopsis dalmanni]|uniref:elongation factor Ts, mitochondrial n=1 Tax=Teleopsis dalmanni TaxID=139649 RepID=UPI0018CCAE0C|nr:elongation factor Ts, mitochondrial [Teleopsis dalmanni]
MFLQQFRRSFHVTRFACNASKEKNALATLRKKTGYTFANCKKALELHQNDLELAEKWLREQAQSLGWSKATKLAERSTAQGLVGVLIRGRIGAMVEVNCETDFVARNEHFKSFVDRASRLCVRYTEASDFDGDLWKLGFESEALMKLSDGEGKSLGDHLALLIGTVGENATIKRAICFKTNNDVQLSGYAHPSLSNDAVLDDITQVGKYGALVAVRSGNKVDDEFQKNLCQHIVGYNPKKIGEEGKDKPLAEKDDEPCLIYQEFIVDPDRSVGEALKEYDVSIVDYQRFECGEKLKSEQVEAVNLN